MRLLTLALALSGAYAATRMYRRAGPVDSRAAPSGHAGATDGYEPGGRSDRSMGALDAAGDGPSGSAVGLPSSEVMSRSDNNGLGPEASPGTGGPLESLDEATGVFAAGPHDAGAGDSGSDGNALTSLGDRPRGNYGMDETAGIDDRAPVHAAAVAGAAAGRTMPASGTGTLTDGRGSATAAGVTSPDAPGQAPEDKPIASLTAAGRR